MATRYNFNTGTFEEIGDTNDVSNLLKDTTTIDTSKYYGVTNPDLTIPGSENGIDTGLGNISDYLGNQSLGDLTKFGGLALGTYDQLFGTGGKAAKQQYKNLKSQGELLRQNIASNKYQMDKTKKFDDMMSKAGSGLGSINTTTKVG